MKVFNIYSTSLFLFILLFLSGCPEEDTDLVNPPSQSERVLIRYVNLSGDMTPHSLRLQSQDLASGIDFGSSSELFNPPADSAKAAIVTGNNVEFEAYRTFKFTRDVTYTFFSLPSIPGDSLHPRETDSIMFFNTSLTIPEITNNSFVRLFNAMPDTSSRFSLVLGCAGGESLSPPLDYRRFSFATQVLSGENTFSIFETKNGQTNSIGLYSADLIAGGEYAFIVHEDINGNPTVKLLDENNPETTALISPEKIEIQNTNLRIVNFSESEIDINLNDTEISDGISPKYIAEYSEIPACRGSAEDNIITLINDDTTSTLPVSLAVLQDYSLFVFDDGQSGKTIQVLAEPFRIFRDTEGKSIIRVINAHPDYLGITASFGAREGVELLPDSTEENTLDQGTTLASELEYGGISEADIYEPGPAPITFFSSTQPAKYITAVNTELDANQEYTLVLYKKPDGTPGVSLITKEEVLKDIETLEDGVLVQFVNAVTGPESVDVGLSPILEESFTTVYYSLSLSTVVKQGTHNLTVNGNSTTIDAQEGKRVLVVAAGDERSIDLLNYTYDPLVADEDKYLIRFLNASRELNTIELAGADLEQIPDFPRYVSSLSYDFLSVPQRVRNESKISIFVYKPNEYEELIHRVDDLKLNFNKAYTLIFIGDSSLGNNQDDINTNNGYAIVLLQEF